MNYQILQVLLSTISSLLSPPFPRSTCSSQMHLLSICRTHQAQVSPLGPLALFFFFFCLEYQMKIFHCLVSSCHLGLSSNQTFLTIQSKFIISLHCHSLACFIFFSQLNPLISPYLFAYVLINLSSPSECKFHESTML